MLFVHLIYVLANYIDVLVLLAEKCSFFQFAGFCQNRRKQMMMKLPRLRKSNVRVGISSCCFFLHILLLPIILEPVCSLLQNYCRAAFWHPPRETHLIIYTNTCSLSHCGKLGVTWTKLEVLQPPLCSRADVRAAICPFVTVLRLATVGVIDCWSGEGPRASFVSRCQMTMSTDGSDLWYRACGLLARYITVLARPPSNGHVPF